MRSKILSCLNMLVLFSQGRRHLRTQRVHPPLSLRPAHYSSGRIHFQIQEAAFVVKLLSSSEERDGCRCLRINRILDPPLRIHVLPNTYANAPRLLLPTRCHLCGVLPAPAPPPECLSHSTPASSPLVASSQPHFFGRK